jgi:hypothetical protein
MTSLIVFDRQWPFFAGMLIGLAGDAVYFSLGF